MGEFFSEHWKDENGNPTGGVSSAKGITVSWQNGPLGCGEDRKEPNGAFVETVIALAKDRLEHYQLSKFKCDENEDAIAFLRGALSVLNNRTVDREARKVEGTHEV